MLYRPACHGSQTSATEPFSAFERHSRPERVILRRRVRDFLLRLGLHLDSGADQELEHIQLQLAEQLRRAKADLLDTQHACLDLENEVKRTNVSLSRLTQDSDRAQKRLQSLQNLKPAFLEDHKKLMAELQETYDMYVACVRNERFLEMEAEKRQAKARAGLLEQQKVLQNIQQKMKDEAANLLACRFDRGTSDDEEEGQKESVNLARKRRSTRESQESKQEETENPFTASGRQLPAETSRRRRPQRRGNGETTERRSSDDVEFSEDMQGNGVPRSRHHGNPRATCSSPACGEDSQSSSFSQERGDDSVFDSDSCFSEEEDEETRAREELNSQHDSHTHTRRVWGKEKEGKLPSLDFHTLMNIEEDLGEESDAAEEVLTATERRRANERAYRQAMEETLF